MKRIAIQAVHDLAVDVFDGANLWPAIDRIERRFKIQGTADYYLKLWKSRHDAYVKEFVESHTTWDQRLWMR